MIRNINRTNREMKKAYLKDLVSLSRRSSIKKFAMKASKRSSSPEKLPRKLEMIQSLSELYLICDLYSNQKRITSRAKESCISLLEREVISESERNNLSSPFDGGAKPKIPPELVQSTMNSPARSESDITREDSSSDSVSFDVVISSPDQSMPGWPLLMIPAPSNSDDSPASKSELDLLLKETERFEYEDLKIATMNFSSENIIGEGGCSSVYKGDLESGKRVAIKVLKPYKEAWNDFSLQVKIASSINHQNIVPLLGICLENGLLISVHDFFPNGSLEDYLHCDKSKAVIPWKVRHEVAVSIAEALNYIHKEGVIHRDVKSSNILLTGELQAQLSDFGLAICGMEDSSHLIDGDVAGTFGYIAPEYLMYGMISEKIDVYAFGVVLLELLSGRKPISASAPKGQESLVKWAYKLLEGGDYVALVDPKLKGNFNSVQIRRMALAARLCVSKSPKTRPKVWQILKLLKGYKVDEQIYSRYEDEGEYSINDSDNKNISPTIDDIIKPRRLKLRDFLNQPLD